MFFSKCFLVFRWYPLRSKNGQDNKERGSLQVKIAFTVKSGSLLDLSKKEKHRLSVGQLSHTASNISKSNDKLRFIIKILGFICTILIRSSFICLQQKKNG